MTQSFRSRTWKLPAFADAASDALIAAGAPRRAAPILAARDMDPASMSAT